MTEKSLYERILLKFSGEALQGDLSGGISPITLNEYAHHVADLISLGLEVGVVIGGGNLFRGKTMAEAGFSRVTGDQMAILATVMNALALQQALDDIGVDAHIMSAIPILGMVSPFNKRQAISLLEKKTVLIFSAGVGHPYFTTDTTASLRAIEIEADVVLKATKVDGVYSADPIKHPDAKKYQSLSFDEVIKNDLQVMDLTAICMCRDQNMPLRIFNINKAGALRAVVTNLDEGTSIGEKKRD